MSDCRCQRGTRTYRNLTKISSFPLYVLYEQTKLSIFGQTQTKEEGKVRSGRIRRVTLIILYLVRYSIL